MCGDTCAENRFVLVEAITQNHGTSTRALLVVAVFGLFSLSRIHDY
jgi:hypothetical protein